MVANSHTHAGSEPIASANSDRHLIIAGRLFDGVDFQENLAVEIADGRIVSLHPMERIPRQLPAKRLAAGVTLAPGFIDIQVNGGGDVLLNDSPSVDTIRRIASAHRRFGTTGLLPTLITDAPEKRAALAACAAKALAVPGVLGFHLEGPFLNPKRKGAHPIEHIGLPAAGDVALFQQFGKFGRSLVTLAPEQLTTSVLRELSEAGLCLAIGHSEARAEEALDAAAHGVTGVTHLFNAMSQLQPRAPGIVGAAMADTRFTAGIIVDGIHVDPLALRAAHAAMGRDRLMLITDAMPTAGGTKTRFAIGDRPVALRDGRLSYTDGTLAGAHLTMIDAVHNAVEMMGATLAEALVMASRTPAHFLGFGHECGRIAPSYRADLVAFAGRDVVATWIAGEIEEYQPASRAARNSRR